MRGPLRFSIYWVLRLLVLCLLLILRKIGCGRRNLFLLRTASCVCLVLFFTEQCHSAEFVMRNTKMDK
ncbi:hypothetical protein F4814DRAFT_405326 [Daldinia grandis]|nr:hypothetical protein F4814DRAFT_405326 [Daldinia grandis]